VGLTAPVSKNIPIFCHLGIFCMNCIDCILGITLLGTRFELPCNQAEVGEHMAVQISPQKATRIMQSYFKGVPQLTISKKTSVNQSTVSRCASRFKAMADEIGVIAAAKEVGIMHEVDGLRSLATELFQNKLTVDDAKEGLHIIKLFSQLGVDPDEHEALIAVCKKVKEDSFIKSALELSKAETATGVTYGVLLSSYEVLFSQVNFLEEKQTKLEAQEEGLSHLIAEKKAEVAKLKKKVSQHKKQTKAQISQLDSALRQKMLESGVATKEIEQVAKLKSELKKMGLDLPTLIELAEEVKNANKKG